MPTWTYDWRVKAGLPADAETALTTINANLTMENIISRAGSYVESDIQQLYWSPYDVGNATVPTPEYLVEMTTLKAKMIAYEALGYLNQTQPGQAEETTTYDKYERMRAALADGVAVLPQILISDEEMTFGTDPLEDHEYRFNPGGLNLEGFEVVPDSVRVTAVADPNTRTYENTHDFAAELQGDTNRAWVFRRRTETIVDTDTVTYRISWLRNDREADNPGVLSGGIHLVRS